MNKLMLACLTVAALTLGCGGEAESDSPTPVAVAPLDEPCAPRPAGGYGVWMRRVSGDCGKPRTTYPTGCRMTRDYRECGETTAYDCDGMAMVEEYDYRKPLLLRQTWTDQDGCVEGYEIDLEPLP